VAGPPGSPTVVLLHGLGATGALNWFTALAALGQRFRVLCLDQRGHGRGIRSLRPFRLEDCADDVIALADALSISTVIPVGYSMGGPVAQLVWRRHPDRVAGLVLCATSASFSVGEDRAAGNLVTLGALALRMTPPGVRQQAMRAMFPVDRNDPSIDQWISRELRRHDPAAIVEAGNALRRFDARGWIRDLDVPAAVVLTTRDRLVSPNGQTELARSTRATIHLVEAGHDACATRPDLFVPALVQACQSVASRSLVGGPA
jgi:3-oxoadipate enol-lactonase